MDPRKLVPVGLLLLKRKKNETIQKYVWEKSNLVLIRGTWATGRAAFEKAGEEEGRKLNYWVKTHFYLFIY